jgi:hypothetical protein
LPVGRNHLTFLNHVHELDALQGDAGRAKGVEAQHRSGEPFDSAMILLD